MGVDKSKNAGSSSDDDAGASTACVDEDVDVADRFIDIAAG